MGTDPDDVTLGPDEICGCTISVRSNEDIIAVWNKSGAEERVRIKIRCVTAPSLSPLFLVRTCLTVWSTAAIGMSYAGC